MTMTDARTKLAGWAAIFAALTLVPEAILATWHDAGRSHGTYLLTGLSALMFLRVCAGAFALFQFRELLHGVAQFRETDRHISWLIYGGFALWLASTVSRLPWWSSPEMPMILLLATGIPLGVISIQFGWRLLRAEVDLAGLRTFFSWTQIVAPLCFMTVILAPIGLLLLMAGLVLLGLMLLKAERALPEFV